MSTSIVAVSYLNTKPFIYGINSKLNPQDYKISLAHPADCAAALIKQEADIGLVPVAVIPDLPNYQIVSDFCIGCDGEVETVCLYSDVPVEDIEVIYLDYQSRTSVNLIKIIARELWEIQPVWKNATEGFIDKIKGTTAGLVIGDRAFDLNDRYQHSYDLGKAWKKLTGLPFVFACWVGKKNISSHVLESFNEALMFGVQQKMEVVDSQETADSVNLKKYLEERIVFGMTEDMKQGLNTFFKYLSTL